MVKCFICPAGCHNDAYPAAYIKRYMCALMTQGRQLSITDMPEQMFEMMEENPEFLRQDIVHKMEELFDKMHSMIKDLSKPKLPYLVTRQACIAALNKPEPISTSTKARHLALMKALMRAAEREWKWIEKSPVIKVTQERNKRVRWLEPAEVKRLINEYPEPLKSTVEFALATELRRSNVVDLKWQQIDMQRKVA